MPRRWTLPAAVLALAFGLALAATLVYSSERHPGGRPAPAAPAAPAAAAMLTAAAASPDAAELAALPPHRGLVRPPAAPPPPQERNRASYRIASRSLQTGERLTASWYGSEFKGMRTASGEPFDPAARTAAHETLPFGTVLRVTNLGNGRWVEVRVNDRGPFVAGRTIDLSEAAFAAIASLNAGVIAVRLDVVVPDGAKSD